MLGASYLIILHYIAMLHELICQINSYQINK